MCPTWLTYAIKQSRGANQEISSRETAVSESTNLRWKKQSRGIFYTLNKKDIGETAISESTNLRWKKQSRAIFTR
jgi:hypothetical protein